MPPRKAIQTDQNSKSTKNPYGVEWERKQKLKNQNKAHRKLDDLALEFYYDPGIAQKDVIIPGRQRRTGRVGVDKELWDVVGKHKTRDIVRNNNWISPLAFERWGERYPDEAAKFEGNWERHNPTDPESEFVIRRRIEGVPREERPLVAINGYTTKASDYGIRSKYYEDESLYDTDTKKFIGSRVKPIGEFAREYFDEKYQLNNYLEPDTGYPTDEYYSTLKRIRNEHGGRLHISAPSPYNIFTKKIVTDAYNVIVLEFEKHCKVPADKTKYILNQTFGHGWLLERASQAWKIYVKGPFLSNLGNYVSNLEAWHAKYQSTSRKIDFNEWIMRQKPIKDVFKDYCRQILTEGTPMYLAILQELMIYFKELCMEALKDDIKPGAADNIVVHRTPKRALPSPVNDDDMVLTDNEGE